MGVFAVVVVLGLVMWFFYTKKKQGLTPNEALSELINGKTKDKSEIITKLQTKKDALAKEAEQVEKIKQLKSEIANENERIKRARE